MVWNDDCRKNRAIAWYGMTITERTVTQHGMVTIPESALTRTVTFGDKGGGDNWGAKGGNIGGTRGGGVFRVVYLGGGRYLGGI